MLRRYILSLGGFVLVGFGLTSPSLAREENSSIERFIDAVRVIARQWHDQRQADIVPMAFAAAGDRRGEVYPQMFSETVANQLRATLRFYSAGDGDAALQRLVAKMDPWSVYLAPPEWRQYEASLAVDYMGVGMDLDRETDGSFTCWPYPGSAADKAGIRPGSKLISVDHHPIAGKSIYAIGTMVRGKRGSAVTLGIGRLGLFTSQINILRSPAHSQTVFDNGIRDGVPSFRIARFASTTPGELTRLLESRSSYSIEIDLTGCRGGDLDSAVSAASLFLSPGDLVASVRRSTGEESLRATGSHRFKPRVVIHQDGDSASAAEVFIAGLTENRVAHSYGSTSHGKATTQDVINLAHGGAIVLTTGLIYGPGGQSWHTRGLPTTGR